MSVLNNRFDIKGRVVVVTGGCGFLGRHFVQGLRQAGARVVVLDQAQGGPLEEDVMFVEANVTDRESLRAALAAITRRCDVPYGLVNAAAIDSPPTADARTNGPFEDYPQELWDQVLDVNLKGAFLVSQVFGGAMAKAGRGSLIHIGSIYGLVAPDQGLYEFRRKNGETFFKPAPYAASKSGLLNLTRYLAAYWGPKVRVNTLTLGGVLNGQPPEFIKEYHRRVPLGRMAGADEYTGAVIFLLSDAASYMTGSNMIMDGGFTAW